MSTPPSAPAAPPADSPGPAAPAPAAAPTPDTAPPGWSPPAAASANVLRTAVNGDGFAAPPGAKPAPVLPPPAGPLPRPEAIMSSKLAEVAAKSPEERARMIQSLLTLPTQWDHSPSTDELRADRTRRGEGIDRILGTAQDAVALGKMIYGYDPDKVMGALDGAQKKDVQALIARFAPAPGDWSGFLGWVDGVTRTQSSGANQVDFLVDGPQAMESIGKEIQGAQQSINLNVFQWEPDETGWKLAHALADKAKAGLKVRVLVDQVGTVVAGKDQAKAMLDFMRQAGVDVRTTKVGLLRGHLDHRKILVLDGKVGFTGGMNVGDDYQVKWHDQQTRLQGPAVNQLQAAFADRWKASGGSIPQAETPALFPELAEVPGGGETHVVSHVGGEDQNIKAMYLRAIQTAKTSIRIANPYFTDQDVMGALSDAAKRGVQVQVVIPRENDEALALGAARDQYPKLIASGVQVYEYLGRMAHDKVATFDGQVTTFGSSNLDARSLRNNDELNCVVSDPALAADVNQRLFDVDLKNSEQITRHHPTMGEKIDAAIRGLI